MDDLRPATPQAAQPQQMPPAPPGGAGAGRAVRLRRRGWLAIALIALLAAGGGVKWWTARHTELLHYSTAPAGYGDVTRSVVATGTVNPELTIMVGTYVSGVIQELHCDYNTRVKAGQVCAKIDPRPYQVVVNQDRANLAAAKAQLEKDKANLAYARLNDERNRWLLERDSTSKDAADLARNAYDQALAQVGLDQATIEQRQAELDAAQINLGYTNIVSPVNGTVVSRNVTQGQTVAASFQTPTLFLIATDLTRMEVDTNVSESDISGTREGAKATFTVDAFPQRVFEGRVTQVRQSPQTVQNVVTFDVVVGVANADLALKPGMTASTRIVADQRRGVLRVPNQAVRYSPGGLAGVTGRDEAAARGGSAPGAGAQSGARLWVLRGGQPTPVAVDLGLEDESYTEILGGDLRPGDAVVLSEDRGPGDSSRKSGPPPPRL